MNLHSNPLSLFGGGGGGGSKLSIQTIFANTDYTEDVRLHLVEVYKCLFIAIASCALGVLTNIVFNIGGLFLCLVSFGLLFYLLCDADKTNTLRRTLVFYAFTFLQGLAIGPLCNLALVVDPAILLTAFVCTSTIFASFSLAAMMAKRRSFMYLGGFLASACMCMLIMQIANIFVPSLSFFFIHLYGGLAIFCLFVIFDTQMILEKASQGSRDIVGHALDLFMDFLSIFVRILVILLRNRRSGGGGGGGGKRELPSNVFDL